MRIERLPRMWGPEAAADRDSYLAAGAARMAELDRMCGIGKRRERPPKARRGPKGGKRDPENRRKLLEERAAAMRAKYARHYRRRQVTMWRCFLCGSTEVCEHREPELVLAMGARR